MVFNTLPRAECVVYNDWWWTASCEYSDIVYGVDSWMEFKYVDMTAEKAKKVFAEHVLGGKIVTEYALAAGSERTL